MSNENIDNQEEIESLKKQIADILDRLNPTRITRKAVQEKLQSDEVISLQARGDELRRQEKELSSTIIATEVFEAKVRRFERLHEDALADGDIEKVREIEQEKFRVLQERKKTIEAVQTLNSQIEAVDGEIRGLLRPLFFDSMADIKSEAAKQLGLVLSFVKSEISDFAALQQEYGIHLLFNPLSEIKIYPEGPLRTLREMLTDELLP